MIKSNKFIDYMYTFNDISLIPQYSEISSRLDTIIKSRISKNFYIDIPVVPSNMDTVISIEMAKKIVENGCIPIFHRFCSIHSQKQFIKELNGRCFISSGINDEDINNALELLNYGALGVCLDVAHGHCKKMIYAIKQIKNLFPNKDIIAGNICTPDGYKDLVDAGADSVKVGIGSGAICTTRMVTGHGISMFTAIYNISEFKKLNNYNIPIIADGGISHYRDIVLSLAAGAECVMMGKLFAATFESAGDKFEKDGRLCKIYRGQASRQFQEEFYGGVKKGTVPEGISGIINVNIYTNNLLGDISGSIRSALTYSGCKDINEFHKKAKFILCHSSDSFMNESNTRILQ
jgi:IMP dehydrogenase